MRSSIFGKSFSSGKCKTLLRLAISRIKLLRNKRDMQVKQMRRELGQLLQAKQDLTARIRVEHVFREQNVMAAYEIIELFSELLVVRLPILESQRQCPIDLREAVASLIFAAPRCADLPELQQISSLFAIKYGKDFVAAATELRPDCGVHRLVIEKLSVRAPTGDIRLKLMKEIAEEQGINWDASALEYELQKPPEDLLDTRDRGFTLPDLGNGATSSSHCSQSPAAPQDDRPFHSLPRCEATALSGDDRQGRTPLDTESYRDAVEAARAAALSAERAAAAAIEIASLAKENLTRMPSEKSKRSSTTESSSASDEDDFREERTVQNGSPRDYFKIRMGAFDAHVAPTKHDSSYGHGHVSKRQPDPFSGHGHVTSKQSNSFNGRGTAKPKSFHGPPVTTTEPVFDDYPEDNARCSRVQSDAMMKQITVEAFTSDEDQSDSTDESDSPPLHRGGNGKLNDREDDAGIRRQPSPPCFDSYPGNAQYQHHPHDYARPISVSLQSAHQRSQPPQRPPPPYLAHEEQQHLAPHVHPKLPDYENLSARFEALKSRR